MGYVDPEKRKAYRRAWERRRVRTPEQLEGRRKQYLVWYEKNRETQKAKRKQAYRNNKEKIAIHQKAKYDKRKLTAAGRASALYQSCKARASRKKLAFSMSVESIRFALELGVCQATGIEFDLQSKGRGPFSPSVDRINNDEGYTDSNIRIVIWAFNAACNIWGERLLMQIFERRKAHLEASK